jgi:hypothetical protein
MSTRAEAQILLDLYRRDESRLFHTDYDHRRWLLTRQAPTALAGMNPGSSTPITITVAGF